jgi:hypothetical protein
MLQPKLRAITLTHSSATVLHLLLPGLLLALATGQPVHMAATATAAAPLGASAGVTSLKESLIGVEPGLVCVTNSKRGLAASGVCSTECSFAAQVQVITAIADSVQEISVSESRSLRWWCRVHYRE